MYAVHLAAFDNAGNHYIARKVFLFDDDSHVTTLPGKVSRIVTASSQTNYVWVVEDTNTVKFQWTDRYRNEKHEAGLWLAEVRQPTEVKDSVYDDHTGDRTVDAINNIHGRLFYCYILNK